MTFSSKLRGYLVGVGILAMAGSASSQPTQELSIGLSSATLTTAPVRIAKDMGIFAKYGLEPKFVVMESGNAAITALISGAIKVALDGPGDLVAAQARGRKVVVIANTYRGLGATLVPSMGTIPSGSPVESREAMKVVSPPRASYVQRAITVKIFGSTASASACSTPGNSGRNTAANASGHSHPRSDGPSSNPATISPTTLGCPTRRASAPNARAAAMMTIN